MVKVSFIVPVYNVEKYMRKCVDSLLAQDYSDYEIILVDDGSTDGSGAICDDFTANSLNANSHVPIRVIHQENAGLSAARNTGIKAARGTYLCFVDSDDYWEENVLGALMEQLEREDLDVLRFDYRNVRIKSKGVNELRNERVYEVFEPNKTPRYIDTKNEVVDGEMYLNTRMGYACYAVMYIMRREIVPLFTQGIHFEDVEWLPRMMLRAKRGNCTTMVVYNYLMRQGSITKTQGDKKKIRKNLEDRLLIIDRYKQYREQNPECAWLYNMQSNMVAGALTAIARDFFAEKKEYIKRLKDIRVFPLKIADQGRTYKSRAELINAFGPQTYCVLIKIKELMR